MGRFLFFVVLFIYILQYVEGFDQLQYDICGNNTQRARSCTTQILGENSVGVSECKIEYYEENSNKCGNKSFGPIMSSFDMGGISLRPYILSVQLKNGSFVSKNRAVFNITFNNIKWKTMKFRFQSSVTRHKENHCRDIILNDLKVDDRSILYYYCYQPLMDSTVIGQPHYLDFEASDGRSVNRGQYYFHVPSALMLSPTVTEKDWLPFVYIEILSPKMKLHIVPPQQQLDIKAYHVKVIEEVEGMSREIIATDIKVKNKSQEVTYEYMSMVSGRYYFTVTPLHDLCAGSGEGCQTVDSPKINIVSDVQKYLNCIVSATAVVVSILFIFFFLLKIIRKRYCQDYSLASGTEIPPAPKLLVIYSPDNRHHSKCVQSFTMLLREIGFDITYDLDIQFTAHGDPTIWATQSFQQATHIIYIVSPHVETNMHNSIYDKPIISPHKGIDKLLLSYIPSSRILRNRKQIINIFFDHSNGPVPKETQLNDGVFVLLKDWNKLIAYLSKNLLPRMQIQRTEQGKCFLDDLDKANKLLTNQPIIKCEKGDKKVLI